MNELRFRQLIENIYQAVRELEEMFDRPFTPDGHMVGSIGECLAAHHYGLELLPCSAKDHDARKGDLLVQIKATQGKSVSFRGEPQHLLVIQLDRNGLFTEIYNGPGNQVWREVIAKPKQSNGQIKMSLSRLRKLMISVVESDKLPRVRG